VLTEHVFNVVSLLKIGNCSRSPQLSECFRINDDNNDDDEEQEDIVIIVCW